MSTSDDHRRAARRSSEEYLVAPGAILEGLPDAVVATARDERIVYVNALAEELFGYPRAEIVGQPVQTLWPERERERYTRNMRHYFAVEHPLRFATEVWGVRRDGSEFVGEMSWGIVETGAGPLLLAIGRDISDRRAGEARLRALADMGERALAGADPAELAGEAVELLCATLPVAAAQVRLAAGATLATAGPEAEMALRLPLGTGDELRVAPERELTHEELGFAHAVAHTLATALERRRSEERMQHDAVHDPLTGLANRTLLRDRLDVALARSARDGSATGVMFIDLDGFKRINDDFGHAAGDVVLVEVGRRLLTAVRPADTVARFGGDEFVVVCEALDEGSALAGGRRLQDAVRLPLTVDGVTHQLTASIGIALGAGSADALLANADAAAYRAKGNGGGRIELVR